MVTVDQNNELVINTEIHSDEYAALVKSLLTVCKKTLENPENVTNIHCDSVFTVLTLVESLIPNVLPKQ